MICGSGGSKSRLAKAAGAEPSGQMRDEQLHAVVVRSTFRSQHVQSTSASENFRKLRCWKSARCCGAKWREAHFQVKSVKADGLGPLLDVQMSFRVAGARGSASCHKWAKCQSVVAVSTTTTALHTPQHYATLQLQLHYTNYMSLRYTTLHSTPLHYTTLHKPQPQLLHYYTTTQLHYTTLH